MSFGIGTCFDVAMDSGAPQEYRFGRFRLLPAQRQLLDGHRPVKLCARSLDMLLTLVGQHEHAVSSSGLHCPKKPAREPSPS